MKARRGVQRWSRVPAPVALMVLGACSVTPAQWPLSSTTLPAAIAAIAGEYDNRRQYRSAPARWRREPAAGHPYDWLDLQHAAFRWVQAPLLGAHVLYLEWRSGGPDGPISRQRLWVFERRQGQWVMDFYTLPDAVAAVSRSRLDADFQSLRPEQLTGYGPDCSLRAASDARGLQFSIPPSCSIVARSGRRMQLSAVVRFEAGGGLRYREQGLLDDGSVAFLVPGRVGLDYVFERVAR